ncbi:unnamed protein product [Symbiodinium sp. CCMP2592]|nr:unnamed protein product [Symbiodinium sp. CCMP2592]
MKVFSQDLDSFAEAFGGDTEQQKFYECRLWCLHLASKRKTCFAESRVRRIVDTNLQSLLRNCLSADKSAARDATYTVLNYAAEGLSLVHQHIAEAMNPLMEDLVDSDTVKNLTRIQDCVETLTMAMRSPNKPQRRKWVSLLVKLLVGGSVRTGPAICRLNMLWLADDSPKKTYEEALHQLRKFEASASPDLQEDLQYLICSG